MVSRPKRVAFTEKHSFFTLHNIVVNIHCRFPVPSDATLLL